MTLAAGARLGPYEIVNALGAGGMGEVYRAKDPRLGRDVAIKVLPASFSGDPDRLRRFEKEARAASALNHPNILTIYDVGREGAAPYVVSELLEGGTLRESVAAGALPSRKAVEYAVQIARGLAAAHEKGIVHRDLKPENIFLTRDGRVKILDFGLAKLMQPQAAEAEATKAPTQTAGTEPGVVMGTVGYMSPEQVRGHPADHRSDIFSFGAMLYEMLAGRRAFRGGSAVETMNAILKEQPPDSTKTNPDVTQSLERIVRRCLEKNPDERFQSARDLAFGLEEALNVSMPSASVVAPPAGRHRGGLWLAVLGAGVAVLLGVILVPRLRGRFPGGASAGPIQSLAVLPLENFSKDPEQEYFADGMTEELITDLAQIRSLRVISRTSVMAYKGTKKSLPEIARELKVDGVLEGSVQRAGNRVRITAQLVEAPTDRHLWAKSYERDLRDVLSLQSDVAQAVTNEIRAALTADERTRLARPRPVDPQVHELYLKGRFLGNKATESDLLKAIEYFEQALARDPAYAPAYAGLADTYILLSDAYRPPYEVWPKAKAAAARALVLDPTLADAHVSTASVHLFFDWDWAAAEREARRAIELNPNSAGAYDVLGDYFMFLGRRQESVAELDRALQLDPLSLLINGDAGWARFMARDYDRAIEQFQKTVDLEPGSGLGLMGLALSRVEKGQCTEAIATAEKATKLDNGSMVLVEAGGVYAACGQAGRARASLVRIAELSRQRYVCPFEVGIVYVGLREKDEAFRWLEKGFQERSVCMPYTMVDPRLDPVRPDPRHADLVRRLGLNR